MRRADVSGVDHTKTTAIDLAEAAYNIQLGAAEWLPNLLEAGGKAFDRGLGCAAATWAGTSDEGQPLITQMHVHAGPRDLAVRFARAAKEVESGLARRTTDARGGGVHLLSECESTRPQVYDAITRHVGCEDVMGVWALDPDLHGIGINIPAPKRLQLHSRTRERWQMLAVHFAAAHRLRRSLGQTGDLPGTPVTEIPLNAEALLDPTRFLVSHATGDAKDAEALQVIREAAVRHDKARGKLRKSDPERALRTWEGLVRGRWSLVDWFDTDGRRFILAKPNAPNVGDPRGLTEREHQVTTYAALGESHKMIGYRLGISRSRVSALLSSSMRKLDVKTQAQLVLRMHGLRMPHKGAA
jgi:DNA-binding CsgD family transcriptional regulator